MAQKLLPTFFPFLALFIGCQKVPDYILSEDIPPIDKTGKATMPSTFVGLDNTITPNAKLLWRKAPGKDDMPIVFSHEFGPRDDLHPESEINVLSRW